MFQIISQNDKSKNFVAKRFFPNFIPSPSTTIIYFLNSFVIFFNLSNTAYRLEELLDDLDSAPEFQSFDFISALHFKYNQVF